MRKFISILFVVAIVATVSLEGCKKYPEGPALSLRSKTARVAGTWTFEKVTLNGTDITALYEGVTVELTKDGKSKWTDATGSDEGEWKFSDDKTKLLTKGNNSNSGWDESTILKLKNSELWLKDETGGVTTETHLKAK